MLSAKGLGDETEAGVWRARIKDDDGRVWRSGADRPEDLWRHWAPAKPGPEVAALRSLRPVSIDVRVEAGPRAAARTFTRRLLAPDVKVRRWKDLGATLYLPPAPTRTLLLEDGELAAPLLASRGAIVLLGEPTDDALERLAAVPGAAVPERVVAPLPPGIPAAHADHDERESGWNVLVG